MAKLKVYGGRYYHRGAAYRAIVAATSQRDVAQTAGVSLHEVRNYWTETGNANEVSAATARPNTLLVHQDKWQGPLVTLDQMPV